MMSKTPVDQQRYSSPLGKHRTSLVDNIQIDNEENLSDDKSHQTKQTFSVFCSLTLHSLGIIYGDIGTSPLYVLETIFSNKKSPPTESQCIGAVSLIIWSLILIVSIKYSIFILQADHKGEGGIFALCALLTGKTSSMNKKGKYFINFISILSASFLIGDGALTPAVSVLSAVEGLALNTPNLHRWVVPITVIIIFSLFLCQQWGTSKIGRTFGPLMFLWFSSLFAIGLYRIRLKPIILKSFNPFQAIKYLIDEKKKSFYHIGGVFLSVTGCEALYADLGHFGLWPIRTSWFCFVFPSVLVNYLGQGAFIIHSPSAIENPFYRSIPSWAYWPMLILATIATIIASQAIITGCFSLLSQATSLGYCPQLRIEHTSSTIYGQIYVPTINWTLMILTLLMTIYFQSSSRLTNAYGLTVCCDSLITTILFVNLLHYRWKKHWIWIIFFSFYLFIDLLFLSSNLLKFLDGAWIAILISMIFYFISFSWFYGEMKLNQSLKQQIHRSKFNELPMRFGWRNERFQSLILTENSNHSFQFDDQNENENENEENHQSLNCLSIIENQIDRKENFIENPYVGCYLTESDNETPYVFENSLRLLHSRAKLILFIKIEKCRIPRINKDKRLMIKYYDEIYFIRAKFGYAENERKSLFDDILLLAKQLYSLPIPDNINEITIFTSNENIQIRKRKNLFHQFLSIPLRFYSIEKSLINQQNSFIQINPQRHIQIGTICQI